MQIRDKLKGLILRCKKMRFHGKKKRIFRFSSHCPLIQSFNQLIHFLPAAGIFPGVEQSVVFSMSVYSLSQVPD